MTEPSRDAQAPPSRVGRYELLERIGKGGMGVVYRGRDTTLGRPVAVKMLVGDLENIEETRERFFREARAAGQLAHRNIITVYDFGEEGGRAFIVMELLQGENLTALLSREPDLALERRLDIMMRVCEGLGFAHSRGIVHRDVKPGNIFITIDGQVKILDFGVARIASSNLTRSGLIVGTPDYMAPEQVQGKQVDHRSDIFSAGTVFYQMLAGRKPFEAKSLPMLLHKVVNEQPPPLSEAEAPADLARIINRALDKDRARRYQQMEEMLVDLTRFAQRFDQQTRELATSLADRYREVERLLEERVALASSLGVAVNAEAVAVAPLLAELPLFQEIGGEVLRAVPFGRARVLEITRLLDQQHERLIGVLGSWREANAAIDASQAQIAAGRIREALTALEAVVTRLPQSGRVRAALEHCRAGLQGREAGERRAQAFLVAARAAIGRSQWDVAETHLLEAERAAPGLDSVADVRRELEVARTAEDARRHAAVERLVTEARTARGRGDFDVAERLAGEALELLPGDGGARQVQREVTEARVASAAQSERARQAAQAIAEARERFAKGDRRVAIQTLEQHVQQLGDTGDLTAALERLRAEDRRLEDLERRRAQAASLVNDARRAVERGEWRVAHQRATEALALDEQNREAQGIKADANARLAEQMAAERRVAEVARLLTNGRALLERGAYAPAAAAARDALALDPANPEVTELLERVRVAEQAEAARAEHERRERALADGARGALWAARVALARRDSRGAIVAIESALAIHPASVTAHRLLTRAEALAARSGRPPYADSPVGLTVEDSSEADTIVLRRPGQMSAWLLFIVGWVVGLRHRIGRLGSRTS